VYVFGAKRANHGAYTATLDGRAAAANGSAVPDAFAQLLFGAGGLPYGEHTLTLANTDAQGGFVDLDYVVVTAGDGRTECVARGSRDGPG
jgi:hypothetical protein